MALRNCPIPETPRFQHPLRTQIEVATVTPMPVQADHQDSATLGFLPIPDKDRILTSWLHRPAFGEEVRNEHGAFYQVGDFGRNRVERVHAEITAT